MARIVEVETSYLSNIEHCRAPIRYGFAKQLLHALPINPEWLVYGKGSISITADFLGLIHVEASDRELFSVVYDEQIRSFLLPLLSDNPLNYLDGNLPTGRARLAALDLLQAQISENIAGIRGDKVDDFCNAIWEYSERLYKNWTEKDKSKYEQVLREMSQSRKIGARREAAAILLRNQTD